MKLDDRLRARAEAELRIAQHALGSAALLYGDDSPEYQRIVDVERSVRSLRAGIHASAHDVIPSEVHEGGWQWRPVDADTAFAPPFSTIRVCRGCQCLVAGGPTACGRCVASEESKS